MQEKFLSFFLYTMVGSLGLLVLLFAWLMQINYSWKGRKELQLSFLLLQGIGSFLLMINAFATPGEGLLCFLYLLVTAAAIWTYLKVKK